MRLNGLLRCLLALLVSICLPSACGDYEINVTDNELKNLDAFEATNLTKADKVFNDKDYSRAIVEYDSFITEFPKSPVLAYAYLRKARSTHLNSKVNRAIKEYREVLDFFHGQIKYTGAAQYYIGKCYWDSGDTDTAVKEWRKLVEDPQYAKHFLTAPALISLADEMTKTSQLDKAAEYYSQVAVNFRDSNPEAARAALQKAICHYVRLAPSEEKTRKLFIDARGWDGNPQKLTGDIGANRQYWDRLRQQIEANGRFDEKKEADARTRYYGAWAAALEGKFPDWDDFQIDAAQYRFIADKDATRFGDTLMAQFQKYQKEGDHARTVKFIQALSSQKSKVAELLSKLDFDKMEAGTIEKLMRIMYEHVKDPAQGAMLVGKLKLDKMSDDQKLHTSRFLWNWDPAQVLTVCTQFGDKELGQFELLRFYHDRQDLPGNRIKGLALCDDVKSSARYTQQATYWKGDFYWWENKWAEALKEYQAADNPPHNLYKVAECYAQMGKVDSAVATLREIESMFKAQSAEAAWRTAQLFRNSEKEYIPKLRAVMKKYPKSHQSSHAHQELERLKVPIGGGVIDEK